MAFFESLKPGGVRRDNLWRRISGPQLFVFSFLLLIIAGTIGLMALPGLFAGEDLNWLDALFTATSAACVTGLIVVDTATYFTKAGQGWILLLIQFGGLGMITFTTLIIVALGQRLSLRTEALNDTTMSVLNNVSAARLTRDVVIFTFGIEAAGALALYLFWFNQLGAVGAVWPAVFHSISAFCNAGFSTFTTSLMDFAGNGGVISVIMILIVLGGLGFLTMEEVYLWRKSHRLAEVRRFSLSLHSRVVLATTAILIFAAWPIFTALEWNTTLRELPVWAKLINGLFLSITPRTAGFNSVDYALTTDSSNFLTILLMSVGGSPGSTAGGVKTTTIALIGLLAWARLRGNDLVSLQGRSVPQETVQRAVGLFVLAFGLITASIMIITITELDILPTQNVPRPFLAFMFEVVSAFNTVGLSMGGTAALSTPGKWLVILLMFVGRVGPLTFAAAVARRVRLPSERFRYAYEDIIVG